MLGRPDNSTSSVTAMLLCVINTMQNAIASPDAKCRLHVTTCDSKVLVQIHARQAVLSPPPISHIYSIPIINLMAYTPT